MDSSKISGKSSSLGVNREKDEKSTSGWLCSLKGATQLGMKRHNLLSNRIFPVALCYQSLHKMWQAAKEKKGLEHTDQSTAFSANRRGKC